MCVCVCVVHVLEWCVRERERVSGELPEDLCEQRCVTESEREIWSLKEKETERSSEQAVEREEIKREREKVQRETRRKKEGIGE